jgi:tetratricopeptide (TPR) repeat protein
MGTKPATRNPKLITHILGITLLIIAVFLAYSNSLDGIWALDDVLINQPLDKEALFERIGARRVSFLSFSVNQKIDPYDPVNFRLFNILIHIFNSILLYVIALITLKLPANRERFEHYSFSIALLSATIFALHPLNINAVSYIIQRMASLATFFVLLSLISYILASRASRLFIKIIMYSVTALFIIFGILSKENAVMAVPLILLYDYTFLSQYNKKEFKRRIILVAIIGLCAFLVSAFYISIHKTALEIAEVFVEGNKPLVHKFWMASDVYWSPLEHILTEFRVIGRYLFLFVLPLPRFLVFDWWGYPISKGIFEPVTTFISIVLILAALVFSIIKLRRFPFISFGILWYFIAISLESFIAVGSDLYFEHRNYLPLTGLSFGLVAQTASVFKGSVLQKKYNPWIIFIVLSALLGFLTFQRNLIWKDPVTLWSDTVQKAPYNIRANLALAHSYIAMSDFQNAKRYYADSIKIAREQRKSHFFTEAIYHLGFMHLILEQKTEAGEVIDLFEELSPESHKFKILKGYQSYLNQDMKSAIRIYQSVLRSNPFFNKKFKRIDRVTIFTLLGDAYREMVLLDKASDSYKKALELNHSFPAAYHGMAKVQMLKGNFDVAFEHLSRVLSIDPYNFHAFSDMAYLLLIRGEGADKALPFAKKAVSLNPPFYKPYLIMGTVMTVLGEDKDAERFYIKAKELLAPGYQLLFQKAWAYSLKGERERQKYYLIELLDQNGVPQNIRNMARKMLSRLTGQQP